MAIIEIVPATEEHAIYIGQRLRRADKREVWAMCRKRGVAAVVDSLRASMKAWTGLVDGEPVCIFGVSSPVMLSTVGVVWLLGTDKLVQHQKAFLRRNKAMLPQMYSVYPTLVNYVDSRNICSIRWLQWLGAKIGAAVPVGAGGEMFMPFEMRQ